MPFPSPLLLPSSALFPGGAASPPATPSTPPVQTRYGYQTAPWDSPLSWGVQALIEYNGYVINDRHQSDRIRVYSITGLDDADSTDSREVVPGDDGEVLYDSYYRGRTFVMTGQIQAGSLGMLRTLERDFRAAFAPLVESPMKFRWFDVYDSFDDPNTLLNYTPVVGSTSSLTVSQGVLLWGTTSQVILMRSADNRLWGDNQTTIRVVIGSVDDSTVFLVPAMTSSVNYIQVSYQASTNSLTISSIVNGNANTLNGVTIFAPPSQFWLRARKEGDLITAEVWNIPPTANAFPSYSTSAWLSGSDADAFGDQVLSQVGFGAQMISTNWALDDFKVESLYPCDVVFSAKKMPNGMSIKDSQDSLVRYSRNFQLTMRASKPFVEAATQTRSLTLVPSSGSVLETGFSSPIRSPLRATDFTPGLLQEATSILSLNNRGTSYLRPRIYLYGAISNFTLINLTNGQQINWSGTLRDGDYLIFDCAQRTLTSASGVNMMDFFSSSSARWMVLEPGWNDLFIAGSGYSGNTNLVVFYKPAVYV